MKLNLLLAAFVGLLGYATCKKFQNKSAMSTPASAPAPMPGEVLNSSHRAAHVYDIAQPDSARPIQRHVPPKRVNVPLDRIPGASTSRKAYLATGWWHVSMAFQPTDTLIHTEYRDRYLKFREDQTFDVLYQGNTVDTGRWNWDENKNELYLSCSNTYFNNTWKVQEKGFVMVWIGNTDVNVTGIQVRVIGTKKDPFNR